MPNFCICKVISDRASVLQDLTGHVRCATAADIQMLMSTEYSVTMLLDIKEFGWAC